MAGMLPTPLRSLATAFAAAPALAAAGLVFAIQ
jgi:hypothetical protein